MNYWNFLFLGEDSAAFLFHFSVVTINISGVTINISGVTLNISGVTINISGVTINITGVTLNISGVTVWKWTTTNGNWWFRLDYLHNTKQLDTDKLNIVTLIFLIFMFSGKFRNRKKCLHGILH